jgi:ankyrin repeat protein
MTISEANQDLQFALESVPDLAKKRKLVKKALEKGANINLRDSDGKAYLHNYIIRGNWDAIKILIDNKIDCSIKDNSGETALDLAERLAEPVVIEAILNGATK